MIQNEPDLSSHFHQWSVSERRVCPVNSTTHAPMFTELLEIPPIGWTWHSPNSGNPELILYPNSRDVRKYGVSNAISKEYMWQEYEAVSEWVTERVLREDKNHSTGLTMSDPPIMVPNEP